MVLTTPPIFENFVTGFEHGDEQAQQRRRRNALSSAGQAYARGRYSDAENVLVGAGMPQEAAQYTALSESRRQRDLRGRQQAAIQQLAPGASAQEQLRAAQGPAMEAGEIDQGVQIQNAISQLDQNQLASMRAGMEFIAAQTESFKQLPPEQRVQAVRDAIGKSPLANNPQTMQRIEQAAADGLITDEELEGWRSEAIGVQNAIQNEQSKRQEAFAERQFGEMQRHNRVAEAQGWASASGAQRPLTFNERSQFAQRYRTAQSRNADDQGILGPALPYALVSIQADGDPRRMPQGTNARMNDVALLRAAARAQTGPGVLTTTEVWQTLSPSLRQALQTNRAYVDIAQTGLRAQDRMALAQYVTQSLSPIQRQAHNLYEDAGIELTPYGLDQREVGIRPTEMVHPADISSLTAQRDQPYIVGNEYTTPAGRQYEYRGPGNWVYRGRGQYAPGNRQQMRDQNARPGATQTNPVRVQTPQEAAQLPPGTWYMGPDGLARRRGGQ